MKSKNDGIKKLVRRWIEIADEDLRLAKYALTMSSNIPYRLICYHSQQAAEKYLKAFLVHHKIDFPFTHNIEYLINLCSKVVDIRKELKNVYVLSKYAVAKRYPGEYQRITKTQANRSIKHAEKVVFVIKKYLN